jgi:DegV family protein with EDD domain
MQKYDIFTDSCCDLPQELVEKYGLKVIQLEVIIDDNPPILNNQLDSKSFYDQLRAGANAKTSAVTPGYFYEEMKKSLDEGKDILYIGFSSGLSVTYSNGATMMQELREEYPDRKIIDIDTLCASVGQGLLVKYAAALREDGVEIEVVRDKIADFKDCVHHQITVDDLFFLKRGGRISATTAIAGSMLKVKPIIIMDKEGHLINVGKVRGRKAVLKELFERLKSNINIDELNYVYISHADCMEDAKYLEAMVKEEYAQAEIVIGDIGPVIGAHTGPGGLALCYLGKTVKGE